MNTEFEINRFGVSRPKPGTTALEDSLVTDARAGLSPAQIIDRRLVALLQGHIARRAQRASTG